jgi:WD40 repeat protein
MVPLPGHDGVVYAATFNGKGDWLATTCGMTAKLWDLGTLSNSDE